MSDEDYVTLVAINILISHMEAIEYSDVYEDELIPPEFHEVIFEKVNELSIKAAAYLQSIR